MKDFYDSEVARLSALIDEWRIKFDLLDRERIKQLEEAQIRLEREQFNHAEDVNQLSKQIALLNAEIINLKTLVDHKNCDLEANMINH